MAEKKSTKMTMQDFLEILKQGQEIWNQWRDDHPDIVPDFNRVDFTDA